VSNCSLYSDSSIAPQANLVAIRSHLAHLYQDASEDALLVVSWKSPHGFLSQWFQIEQAEQAAKFIAEKAQHHNVYIGVGLRNPTCSSGPSVRGESKDVYAIPGVWVDFDHAGGNHTAPNLPKPNELRDFISNLPCRFSLLVDSGGGIHGYLLFKELWHLDTPEERSQATTLLKRVQWYIQRRAAEHGWKVDSTADLARVLRPAGTLNHKSETPQLVKVIHEGAIRYNPSDIADAPWLAGIEVGDAAGYQVDDGFPAADLDRIVAECAWLRHCRDDAATLTEPEWYGMLGILGRCANGEQIAHEWSQAYPGYTPDETRQKLRHALAASGPRTCEGIRYDLGGEPYCHQCPHWQHIKSPIVLGMDDGARLEMAQDEPAPGNGRLDLSGALLRYPDMLALDIPKRRRWIDWLSERGLAMVYGPRGVGKTQFMLGLALSLESGGEFLSWKIPEGVGVLYVDGEMAIDELRERAQKQAGDRDLNNLYFLTSEMVYTKTGRDLVLTQEAFREAVMRLLEAHSDIKVVILDNISCLFSGISEDKKQDWEPINAWLIQLRHRGLSVILVHHAGKSGEQRGTSGREDALDTIIALNWPVDPDPQEGCHFQLRFTKSRSVKGEAVQRLDIRLEETDGAMVWQFEPLEASLFDQVCNLLAEGLDRPTDIAEELGISKGYASKLKRRVELTGAGIVL